MTRADRQVSSHLLDNQSKLLERDPGGMLARLAEFPEQLRAALECGRGSPLPEAGRIDRVVFCGMGGSAIGAELLKSWLGTRLKVPLVVNRNPVLPGFVNQSTLVVACSYSGNTRETLAAFERARAAGASLACVSSGGELGRRAREIDIPWATIPGGLPPRAAVAFMTVPPVQLLHRAGLVADCEAEVLRAADWLHDRLPEYGPSHATEANPAKILARALQGKPTVVYGSQDRLDGVARRWAGQFSENAKQLTFFGAIPEMTHNEIVGWMGSLPSATDWAAVFLHDNDDPILVRRQAQLTREMLERRVLCLLVRPSEGPWLGRLWDLVLLGDYASVYLALLNHEDPTPVLAIDRLKAGMEEFHRGDATQQ